MTIRLLEKEEATDIKIRIGGQRAVSGQLAFSTGSFSAELDLTGQSADLDYYQQAWLEGW